VTKPIGVGASDADALGYDTFVADPIPMNALRETSDGLGVVEVRKGKKCQGYRVIYPGQEIE
jgi:hypothetical protein